MKKILVTGSSGFIGYHLCERLLNDKDINIIGLDNMNDYYDINLKKARLDNLSKYDNFTFINGDISDKKTIEDLFKDNTFDIVINLAAQAGVRYSIDNPDVYINSNIIGFYNILEAIRNNPVDHFIYASSSSVYGGNTKVPFDTDDKTDHPVSLYAATKKTDELIAYAYSHLFNIKTTGLRFFTVYGPYGRPDMAYYSFTNKLLNNEKIKIFNYGNCKRDFTYIDDIIQGIIKVIEKGPIDNYNLYNIGNNRPEDLMRFVSVLSDTLIKYELLPIDFDIEKHIELVPMQDGDVEVTYADTSKLEKDYGFKPDTSLEEGLDRFVSWYKEYYK